MRPVSNWHLLCLYCTFFKNSRVYVQHKIYYSQALKLRVVVHLVDETAGLSETTWKTQKTGRKYQLWTGVVPPSHSAFPWSTSETEFQNGIWLPSVCSTSPADLWRGGGRSADSTLMGRPTKAALRLCSLDPVLTGLAGHRDNELQTRESAALSPWNLVVGSGGRDWAQSDPARLWEAWACHALPAQSFWNFLHTSPCRIFPAVMYGGHIPREHFHICLSARKKMPHCMIWLFIILRKLLTIASEHAPQLRISAWTEFREMFIVECVPRGMPYKRESRTWSLRMLLVVWCMCHGWHVGK